MCYNICDNGYYAKKKLSTIEGEEENESGKFVCEKAKFKRR